MMDVGEPSTAAAPIADQSLIRSSQWKEEFVYHLPPCSIDGCKRLVHYDVHLPEEMRLFTYCSPQCRDKDLEKDKENLGRDIRKMEQILKSMKMPIPKMEQKSKSTKTPISFDHKKMPAMGESASGLKPEIIPAPSGSSGNCCGVTGAFFHGTCTYIVSTSHQRKATCWL